MQLPLSYWSFVRTITKTSLNFTIVDEGTTPVTLVYNIVNMKNMLEKKFPRF